MRFVREPLMIRCLPKGCSEAGSGYQYANKDTGECMKHCEGTHPLLDEAGKFCVASCETYKHDANGYQCVSRCPADAAKQ